VQLTEVKPCCSEMVLNTCDKATEKLDVDYGSDLNENNCDKSK